MTLSEQVQNTIETKLQDFSKDPKFIQLSEFYKEMQEAGIAKKQAYSLPPTDTIGIRLYQLFSNQTKR